MDENEAACRTALRIRDPGLEFFQMAEDCDKSGTFDTAIANLRNMLVEAAKRNDAKSCNLYTRAFIAFLAYKEGHYAVRPAALTLPAAAFEPPT
jgi:hypothetical protein